MIEPIVVTPAVTMPVSLAEAKYQCAIDQASTTHDTLLTLYIDAAREYFEWRAGYTIHETEYGLVLDRFPGCRYIELPRATPLISITDVQYIDAVTGAASMPLADYIADTDSKPGRVVLAYQASWPSFTAAPVSPVRVTYKAGIASASPVVEAASKVKIPILMLVSGMFENRESVVISDRAQVSQIATDYGVEAFIAQSVSEWVC